MAFSRKIMFLPSLSKIPLDHVPFISALHYLELCLEEKMNSDRLTLLFKNLINLKYFRHFLKQNA